MNTYKELKKIYEGRRELIGDLPEKESIFGQRVAQTVCRRHSLRDNYRYGTHNWTKISMSTIILAAENMGWERYIDLLGKYQLPAQRKHAAEVAKKYNIPTDTFAGFMMTAILWGQGCLFDLTETGCQPIFSQHDAAWNMGDKCPQIDALEEMGIADKAENLYIWCDAYDEMICSANYDKGWYSHLKCTGMKDCDHCASYMHEMAEVPEQDPGESRGDHYYEKIMKMKKISRELYDAHPSTKNWRETPLTDSFTNGILYETYTPEQGAENGTVIKGNIAAESIVIAAKEMGWEKFINASEEMLSWGFSQGAKDAKSWTGVKLSDMFSACELVSSVLFMLNFKEHQITEFDENHACGYAPKCKIHEAVENLGLLDDAKDFHLWCDWYHNFYVKQLNSDYRITFSHCLCNGDPECKFEIYKENADAK